MAVRAKPASRHLLSKAEVQYYVRMLLQMKPMAFMLLLVLVTGFCWPAASDVPAQPTVEAETEIYAFKPANSALVLGTTNVYDSGESGFTVAPGQLFATFDSEGWQKHSYDVRGRELKTSRYLNTTALTYTIQASFDDADHVRTLAYPSSLLTVTNGYDTGGHLSDVWRSDGGTNTHYLHYRGFTELNQPLGADFGNGVTTTNDYWPVSRRLHSLTTFIGGTNLQSLSYEYNRADDVSAINDAAYTGTSSASLSATYDDLHRLASVTRSSNTVSFSYSAIGNVLANGEWPGAGYDYGSRLPHAVKKVGSQYYAYDMNGNTVARGVQNLRYDAANHLVLVRSNGVALASFGSADDGSRLWKKTGTNLQIWIGSFYEEKQGKRLCHVWAGGWRVATFDSAGTLASGTNTTSLYYCHQDHLGSSSVLSDHAGNRVEHYEYSAFGRERYNDPAVAFPVSQRFTGQVLDDAIGLYYYGARYYDADLGRFIQPDTVISDFSNPQSYNRYTYTLNNPLKYVDPDGRMPFLIVALLWGAAGFGGGHAAIATYEHTSIARSEAAALTAQQRFAEHGGYANYGDYLLNLSDGSQVFTSGQPEFVRGAASMVRVGFEAEMTVAATFVPVAVKPAGGVSLEGTGIATETPVKVNLNRPVPEAKNAAAREGIYEFTGRTGRPYVGQSGSIEQRLQQHLNTGKLPAENVPTAKRTEVPGGKTVREVAEQRRLDQLGGPGAPENVRNPIGPARKYLLGE